jgi:hypothetical protein
MLFVLLYTLFADNPQARRLVSVHLGVDEEVFSEVAAEQFSVIYDATKDSG